MPWKVFYSYAHEDQDLCKRLGVFLAPLKRQGKIIEWYDRKISPGINWNKEINAQLDSANLILLLVSPDFLASDYCFGIEIDKAMTRLKRGEAIVVPILLKQCLWKESPFSELQMVPRDTGNNVKAVVSWPSADDGLTQVAEEIRKVVSNPLPLPSAPVSELGAADDFRKSVEAVRAQIRSYAHLYERTRQRMKPSGERTQRMEQIFAKMLNLAVAAHPLLAELSTSPSPGERLAAVAILQVISSVQYFPFLVKLVSSEKPFVGYQAARALDFAVGAIDPRLYPQLLKEIASAEEALRFASVGFDTDRQTVLRQAKAELERNIDALAVPSQNYD
jgi:hypothetical protein